MISTTDTHQHAMMRDAAQRDPHADLLDTIATHCEAETDETGEIWYVLEDATNRWPGGYEADPLTVTNAAAFSDILKAADPEGQCTDPDPERPRVLVAATDPAQPVAGYDLLREVCETLKAYENYPLLDEEAFWVIEHERNVRDVDEYGRADVIKYVSGIITADHPAEEWHAEDIADRITPEAEELLFILEGCRYSCHREYLYGCDHGLYVPDETHLETARAIIDEARAGRIMTATNRPYDFTILHPDADAAPSSVPTYRLKDGRAVSAHASERETMNVLYGLNPWE